MGILSEKGGFLLKPVYDALEIFGKDRWVGVRDGSWTEMVDRDSLFRRADVLTLHVPLTPETKHSIGARELAAMKKDAILVNASRGGVVDEAALQAALTSGALRGAAVDVFEHEPAPADHPLLALPNVLPLPHLGASTAEAQKRAGTEAADILIAELAKLS